MKAVCLFNDPRQLADHQRNRFAKSEGKYPLTKGRTYPVVGMCIWENVLLLLVRDDWNLPCFASAGFFDIFTASIPTGWLFALKPGIHASGRALWESPGVAVWGYPELVGDPDHFAAVQLHDPEALAIFNRYYEIAETADGA